MDKFLHSFLKPVPKRHQFYVSSFDTLTQKYRHLNQFSTGPPIGMESSCKLVRATIVENYLKIKHWGELSSINKNTWQGEIKLAEYNRFTV